MTRIRTAIVPAAGLGTLMLPATEAVPKALLPVGGRPALDWVLDEAAIAGIERVVVASSERNPAIEAYLSAGVRSGRQYPSERQRAMLGLTSEEPSRPLAIEVVQQPEPLGLGDALLRAWHAIGDEPVAVLLPDELMLGGAELLATMLEHHDRQARSMVAVAQVPLVEIGAYGCVELSNSGTHPTMSVTRCVEKPAPGMAPSDFAICGRYLLGVDILHALETPEPGQRDEVPFMTALDTAARSNDLVSIEVLPRDGRIDIGNWFGWLHANRREFESRHSADKSRPPLLTGHTAHSPASMVA
ncbi:MAG: UTP--glucose-phosphate uridylyltransferase [Acidimicrobiaceae bacterium]|nr:UTP--glucose-phosphate uridylyltransferase [Acidimicrobiaceae bacterium]